MKKTFMTLTIILLTLITTSVFAADITLSWNPTTMNQAYCTDTSGKVTQECDGANQIDCEANGGTWTDRTPVTDLGGYKIAWGTSSGSYPNIVDVSLVTSYELTGLPDDTDIYVVVSSYDTSGSTCGTSDEAHILTVTPDDGKVPYTEKPEPTCQQINTNVYIGTNVLPSN